MAKTVKQKNFNNFVWTPLGSRVNIFINFCLQVHFKLSAAWYCCHYLPPVSTTPAANLPPASLTPVANLPPVSTTLAKMVEKFATGVADTGGKFATGVVDTGGAPWLANISANFRKNLKRSKWNTLELGGNWFMKKARSKKSRDTVPLSVKILRVHLPFPGWNKSFLKNRYQVICFFHNCWTPIRIHRIPTSRREPNVIGSVFRTQFRIQNTAAAICTRSKHGWDYQANHW